MRKHTIEIDDDVLLALRDEAMPGESDSEVLRRLLLDPARDPGGAFVLRERAKPQRKVGDLRALMHANKVSPGDELIFEQPRLSRVHRATIRHDGSIELANGKVFPYVSGALTESVGNQMNGWLWRHVRSGRTLDELRKELQQP